MGSERWPPTNSSRVLAPVSKIFHVDARAGAPAWPSRLGQASEPGAGRECLSGRAAALEGWSGDRREELRGVKRKDYISQAATLSSWSPRALTAPQFP